MNIPLVSIREAASQTGQPEGKIRSLIRQGKLRVVRIGYNILIRKAELKKLRPAAKES